MGRNRAKRKLANPRFAFVVDGECEYWYIQMLNRNERTIHVDLKPEIPQKKKLKDQYEKVIELAADYDKVFWIIDFDVINSETRKAKSGSKTAIQELSEYSDKFKTQFKNVTLIINNPCFEYWILLHYETTSKFYNSYTAVVKQLKKHLPTYEKSQTYYTKQGNDIYQRLKQFLPQAIKNTERLDKFDLLNPETGMSQMNLFFNTEPIKKIVENI